MKLASGTAYNPKETFHATVIPGDTTDAVSVRIVRYRTCDLDGHGHYLRWSDSSWCSFSKFEVLPGEAYLKFDGLSGGFILEALRNAIEDSSERRK